LTPLALVYGQHQVCAVNASPERVRVGESRQPRNPRLSNHPTIMTDPIDATPLSEDDLSDVSGGAYMGGRTTEVDQKKQDQVTKANKEKKQKKAP
jgi:hypothetical protein